MFTEAATTKLDAILVETTEGGERSRKQRHVDMIRSLRFAAEIWKLQLDLVRWFVSTLQYKLHDCLGFLGRSMISVESWFVCLFRGSVGCLVCSFHDLADSVVWSSHDYLISAYHFSFEYCDLVCWFVCYHCSSMVSFARSLHGFVSDFRSLFPLLTAVGGHTGQRHCRTIHNERRCLPRRHAMRVRRSTHPRTSPVVFCCTAPHRARMVGSVLVLSSKTSKPFGGVSLSSFSLSTVSTAATEGASRLATTTPRRTTG